MTIKEFFSLKKNRFFWINIFAMIVLVCVIAVAVLKSLDSYTRHGQAILVPDVTGKTVREAEIILHQRGLNSLVSDSAYVKDKPAGIVLDHLPAMNQKVKEGRPIYLTVNTSSVPTKTVPDVADNSSLRQAQARILAAGFKLTSNESVAGEKDWVYNVKYKGRILEIGDKVPVESTLTLVVGNGDRAQSDELASDSIDTTIDPSWFD